MDASLPPWPSTPGGESYSDAVVPPTSQVESLVGCMQDSLCAETSNKSRFSRGEGQQRPLLAVRAFYSLDAKGLFPAKRMLQLPLV